ncbi:MAG: DUF5320 domain-containing protein [Candidatus Bathyarchaeales archaeon]
MGWRYTPRGWWCPRHPWPPAWARAYAYPVTHHPYVAEPQEEIKALETIKRDLEFGLAEINKRIEELKRLIQEKK